MRPMVSDLLVCSVWVANGVLMGEGERVVEMGCVSGFEIAERVQRKRSTKARPCPSAHSELEAMLAPPVTQLYSASEQHLNPTLGPISSRRRMSSASQPKVE